MNDDHMRDLFREMRDEPVPADSRARVHQAVSARIARRQAGLGWRIAAIAAVAACAVIAFVAVQPAPQPPRPPAPVSVLHPRVAPPPVPVPVPAAPAPSAPPPTPQRAPRPAVDAEPAFITTADTSIVPAMTIRIETPDPQVVILLVN